MKQDTAVLYHDDNDGFAAAYACWLKLKNEAIYLPVQYGQPVPELPASIRKLYIVDFSYDRDTCDRLNLNMDFFVVLDHHKTAEAAIGDAPYAIFNQEKSGCTIAWNLLHRGTPAPELLLYVEDYDLWRFMRPSSKEVNLFISTLPRNFESWHFAATTPPDAFVQQSVLLGTAVRAFQGKQIDAACNEARLESVAGFLVPCANVSANTSEVGNELCLRFPEAAFSVTYCDRKDQRTWSLRSVGAFDVSELARQFGGGGHCNAAGFATAVGESLGTRS